MESDTALLLRASRHAALGEPIRLAIIDALRSSDRSPSELQQLLNLGSNLVSHHLDVLEAVGLVRRLRSSGDGRRRYVSLRRDISSEDRRAGVRTRRRAVFICSHNSARSQLAAALWRRTFDVPADSAGTHPAQAVHPGALAAASRAGFDLGGSRPRPVTARLLQGALVVTVCDRAHEELAVRPGWLHWSVADPVVVGTERAFNDVIDDLSARIDGLQPQPGDAS